jgi:hypothetical protein
VQVRGIRQSQLVWPVESTHASNEWTVRICTIRTTATAIAVWRAPLPAFPSVKSGCRVGEIWVRRRSVPVVGATSAKLEMGFRKLRAGQPVRCVV